MPDYLISSGVTCAKSVNHGDFSHRELFAARGTGAKSVQTKELSIQRWVAATLQLAARGIYSVERETETLNRNKVDICARVPGLARLPIEIKPIGSYSEKGLKETIRDQLLGKYMLPREVSHGILLLVQLSQRSHAVAKRRKASFADLCAALIRYARGFAVSDGKVIDAVSIALAEPRQRRSRKRRAPKQQRKRRQGASARQPKPVPRHRKRKHS